MLFICEEIQYFCRFSACRFFDLSESENLHYDDCLVIIIVVVYCIFCGFDVCTGFCKYLLERFFVDIFKGLFPYWTPHVMVICEDIGIVLVWCLRSDQLYASNFQVLDDL